MGHKKGDFWNNKHYWDNNPTLQKTKWHLHDLEVNMCYSTINQCLYNMSSFINYSNLKWLFYCSPRGHCGRVDKVVTTLITSQSTLRLLSYPALSGALDFNLINWLGLSVLLLKVLVFLWVLLASSTKKNWLPRNCPKHGS